jgi:broad specificity phosphatase PhoE
MMQSDPPLSKPGKLRAEKLVATLQDQPIQAIYSTKFNRTRSTVIPISAKLSVGIQLYDPTKQAEFAQLLKSQKGATILVVGHSNTIPALVNLLSGTTNYPNLDDNEYDKIWIVTLKDGKALVEQMVY